MYTVLKKCRYISICDMMFDLGTFASETVKHTISTLSTWGDTFASETVKHTNERVVFRKVAVRKSVSNFTKSSNSSRVFFTV